MYFCHDSTGIDENSKPSNAQYPALKTTFKLFPSVRASQILWKFVPNCWSAHTETMRGMMMLLWSVDRSRK